MKLLLGKLLYKLPFVQSSLMRCFYGSITRRDKVVGKFMAYLYSPSIKK